MALNVVEDFLGTTCSVCRHAKPSRYSFCGRCYYALPNQMVRALYQRFGEGYEEAFAAAQIWLRENESQKSLKL